MSVVTSACDGLDRARFREAMARFPTGVTIVTTVAEDGSWKGFTANAFCSVSQEPPLVLVCLAATAECHPAFERASEWVIHLVHERHADLALQFATRGADKFGDGRFHASDGGLPVLHDACAALHCAAVDRHEGGDHTILVGRVKRVDLGEPRPAVYFNRAFHPSPAGAREPSQDR